MNKREAKEQLMNNSDSSSGGSTGVVVELPNSIATTNNNNSKKNSSSNSSPNKRSTSSSKTRQSPKDNKNKKPETVALDMAANSQQIRNNRGRGESGGGGGDDCGDGNDSNNSTSNLKKLSGDLEKMHSSDSMSSSAAGSTSCTKTTICLIFFTLMSLIIIIAAIFVAILHFDLLGNEDQCLSANSPFQANQFKLFTTKTTYQTAFDQIDHAIKHNEAPKVFSRDHSLKSIHAKLTAVPHNCKVRQLHYYGRHAARFPDRGDIGELNEAINKIKGRIDFSKFLPPTPVQTNATSTGIDTSKLITVKPPRGGDSVTIVSTHDTTSARPEERVCSNPMVSYEQWSPIMHPDQDNLITDSGFNETEAIVARLKEIFPQMFDASQSSIKINTTKEIRTAQTAVPFIKHLTNYKFSDACPSVNSFPSTNLSSDASVSEIRSNHCLEDLLRSSYSDALDSHKKCASYARIDTPVGMQLDKNHFKAIAKSISVNLKLPKEAQLSLDEVKDLYDICKYETALGGKSIWCNLFSEQDLKFFEYFDDIEDYYKDAFFDSDQAKSACAINAAMMDSIDAATRQSTGTQTHLHFTHSQIIRKLLAASFELFEDVGYSAEEVANHLRLGTVPAHRNWRTSLFTPFSANLLFTLYECDPKYSSSDGNRIIQVNDQGFVVVASLNEHPVLMERCSDVVCDLNVFKKSKFGKIADKDDCDLRKICRKKYSMKKNVP